MLRENGNNYAEFDVSKLTVFCVNVFSTMDDSTLDSQENEDTTQKTDSNYPDTTQKEDSTTRKTDSNCPNTTQKEDSTTQKADSNYPDTTQKEDSTTQKADSNYPDTTQKEDSTTQKADSNYPDTTQKGNGATRKLSVIQQRIVNYIKENPKAGRKELAEKIGGITENGIKYHLQRLRQIGIITRVGADRGGHWKINK